MPELFANLRESANFKYSILIHLSVGLIFFTQGVLKFIDPNWGVLRFAKIGFPFPDFTAHFVGTFEIICGFLVLIRFLTRLASIPLLVINLTAITTTKIPELFHPEQGFWFMVSDARSVLCNYRGLRWPPFFVAKRSVFATSKIVVRLAFKLSCMHSKN